MAGFGVGFEVIRQQRGQIESPIELPRIGQAKPQKCKMGRSIGARHVMLGARHDQGLDRITSNEPAQGGHRPPFQGVAAGRKQVRCFGQDAGRHQDCIGGLEPGHQPVECQERVSIQRLCLVSCSGAASPTTSTTSRFSTSGTGRLNYAKSRCASLVGLRRRHRQCGRAFILVPRGRRSPAKPWRSPPAFTNCG